MSQFGNLPVEAVADAVEKHVAKMDEAELAALLLGALATMPRDAVGALVSAVFDAFRERGESSEDAAEGANASLASLEAGDPHAVDALIGYARDNTGLLKEAMTIYAQDHTALMHALPKPFVDGIAQRL